MVLAIVLNALNTVCSIVASVIYAVWMEVAALLIYCSIFVLKSDTSNSVLDVISVLE